MSSVHLIVSLAFVFGFFFCLCFCSIGFFARILLSQLPFALHLERLRKAISLALILLSCVTALKACCSLRSHTRKTVESALENLIHCSLYVYNKRSRRQSSVTPRTNTFSAILYFDNSCVCPREKMTLSPISSMHRKYDVITPMLTEISCKAHVQILQNLLYSLGDF